MKECEIKEGDIVEIDYIDALTQERISEGKALILWKGFNHQPLIRKLDAKRTIWSGYDHIARVISHVDIEKYMDDFMENTIALEQEPCWTPIGEKLPKEKEDVLIQYRTGGVDKMAVSSRIDYNYWVGFGLDICVVAWQPLPTPYKANNEEKS